jgi:ankyrin repeat protein
MKITINVLCLNILLCPAVNAGQCASAMKISCSKGIAPIQNNRELDARSDAFLESLNHIMQGKATLDSNDENGNTVLHYAAKHASHELLSTYVKKRPALLNKINNNGETALEFSLSKDSEVEALELIKMGANPDLANQQGILPIHIAVVGGKLNVVKALLAKDKKYASIVIPVIEESKWSGMSPLDFCIISNMRVDAILDELVHAGAPIDTADAKGQTPLMKALANGRETAAKILMAQTNVKTTRSAITESTLLHYAATGDLTNLVEPIILKYGIDVNAVNKDGDTPLHVAEITLNSKTAAKLRELGAREDIVDKDGYKPAQLKAIGAQIMLYSLFQKLEPSDV